MSVTPDIVVLYLTDEECKMAELHYDKANSDLFMHERKDVVFDPLSKRIVAFTSLDP